MIIANIQTLLYVQLVALIDQAQLLLRYFAVISTSQNLNPQWDNGPNSNAGGPYSAAWWRHVK